jgi:hypothetical protein
MKRLISVAIFFPWEKWEMGRRGKDIKSLKGMKSMKGAKGEFWDEGTGRGKFGCGWGGAGLGYYCLEIRLVLGYGLHETR